MNYKFNAEKITTKVINWIKEQVGDCKVVIGISGGKDSTICAMLLKLAIGEERIYGFMMPNGVQKDIADSEAICKTLGIHSYTIDIWQTFVALSTEVNKKMKAACQNNDGYKTNTPARLRMTTLYGAAHILGNARVINTCNGDEDHVGYSTKFGDSAGDFSPLADFTVAEVLAIGKVAAERLGIYDKVKYLIEKTPDDGMSGMSDEQKLGFTYEVLGNYRRTGKCEDEKTKALIDRMHANNLHKITPMPKFEYKGR